MLIFKFTSHWRGMKERAVVEETFIVKRFPACSDTQPEEAGRTHAWGSQAAIRTR